MMSPDKAKRAVSQAPLKETTCHAGCGATVSYRTSPRVICQKCKPERRAEQMRAVAERQRRRRGIAKVKGTVIVCARCGADVVLNRRKDASLCRPCYRAKNSAEAPARAAKKRATPEGKRYANEWQRERRRSDPAWGVSSHVRTLIHRALGKRKAGRSWREFVPYSLEELMAHLERQFLPGMNWKNRGEWHIDHIRPLCSFEFQTPDDPQFREAWALTNLRPLWGPDNLRKSGRRDLLL